MNGSLPRLMDLQERFADRRDDFAILAFHDDSVKGFRELDPKLHELEAGAWNGRELPFPILLDESGATLETYGVRAFPTTVAIDPQGRIVKGYGESLLEEYLLSTSTAVSELLRGFEEDFARHLKEAVRRKDDYAAYALTRFAAESAAENQLERIHESLERIGGPLAVRFFAGEHGLKSPVRNTRLFAANALRTCAEPGDWIALSALAAAHGDEDRSVRKAVEKALDALRTD